MARISQLEAQVEIQPLNTKSLSHFPVSQETGVTTIKSEVHSEPLVVKQTEPVAIVPPPSLPPPLVTLIPTLPILVKKTEVVPVPSEEREPEEDKGPIFTRCENLPDCWTYTPSPAKSVNPAPSSPEAPPFSENLQSPPKKAKPQRALVFVTKPADEETVKSPDQTSENASRVKLVTFAPTTTETPPETVAEQSWLPPPRFARFKPAPEKVVDETNPPAAD